jgi:hypothetical protein
MNNPLQPRAALALAVAQGEDLNFDAEGLFLGPLPWRWLGEADGHLI